MEALSLIDGQPIRDLFAEEEQSRAAQIESVRSEAAEERKNEQ